MKRTLLTALAVLAIGSGLLHAQTADEVYLKAMQLSDNCQKIQALDAYIAGYAGKGGQYDNYAFAYYFLTPCASKNAQKAMEYGQKALTMPGLDEQTKLKINLTIPQQYAAMGQLDQAKAAAQKVIDLGKATTDPKMSAALQAQGYVYIGEYAEKAGDFGGAANAYITAYGILKDPSIDKKLNGLAATLIKNQKYAEAEQVFRQIYNSDRSPENASRLAQIFMKENKTDEALATYKEAYARKRTPALARDIAIILNREVKKDPSKTTETINALIEAGLLNPNESKAFLQGAQNLFVGQDPSLKDNVAKIEEHQKALEEYTKTYNEKFGNKGEDELSGTEKATMKKLQDAMNAEQQAIDHLKGSQKDVLVKFDALVSQIKARLGR